MSNTQKKGAFFVYFGRSDIAGHDYGWMSNRYLAQLERVEKALGYWMRFLS